MSTTALISDLAIGERFELQSTHGEAISDSERITVTDSVEIVTIIAHGHDRATVQHADGTTSEVFDHRVWPVA